MPPEPTMSPAPAPAASEPSQAPAAPTPPSPSPAVPPAAPPAAAAPPAPPAPAPAPPAPKGIRDQIRDIREKPTEAEPPGPEGEQPPTPEGEQPPTPGEPEPIIAKLPGRREGDPDVEIELPPGEQGQEVLERLNQLRNGFVRGEEVRAAYQQLEQDRDAVQTMLDTVVTDPADFLGRNLEVGERAFLALALLASDPEVLEHSMKLSTADDPLSVADLLGRLLDPEQSERILSRIERRRLLERDGRRQALEDRRTMRQRGREMQQIVEALVPEGLSEEQAALFLRDARQDLVYAARSSQRALEPADVPTILLPRLRALGMSEDAVRTRLQRRTEGGRLPVGAPASGQPPASPARIPVQPTIADLTAAAERRRAVATPGAGVAVPAPTAAFPDVGDATTIKEATARIRARKAGRT